MFIIYSLCLADMNQTFSSWLGPAEGYYNTFHYKNFSFVDDSQNDPVGSREALTRTEDMIYV